MLKESDLSNTKSSRSGSDTRTRLEQAKHRYENLLLHVGPTMIADDLSTTLSKSKSNSDGNQLPNPPLSSSLVDRSAASSLAFETSPDVSRSFDKSSRGFNFAGFESSQYRKPEFSTRLFDESRIHDERNLNSEDTIVLLQEENDRLRSQVDHLTSSTEQLLQEAEDTTMELVKQYETKLNGLSRKNQRLVDANAELEASLHSTRQELATERAQLQKALQLLDRFQRRSRDYVEVQKKSTAVIKHIDGMHYTAHMHNEQLLHLQQQQQQEQEQQLHTRSPSPSSPHSHTGILDESHGTLITSPYND